MLTTPPLRPLHLCTLALVAALASPGWSQTPNTAVGPQPTQFPGRSGNFELFSSGTPFQHAPAWPDWTFSANAGIARNGATILRQSASAPLGTCVAFLEGPGSVIASATFTAGQLGQYRLRFRAAQRRTNTTADSQHLRIQLGAQVLFDLAPEGTNFKTYATEPFTITAAGTVQFLFGGLGAATDLAMLDHVELQRILPWQTGSNWSLGRSPVPTDTVTIPEHVAVSIGGTAKVADVTVEGSLLAENVDTDLSTNWLLVTGPDSSLVVGSPWRPFLNKFRLTLMGLPSDVSIMNAGTKFLMAMDGGRLWMFGQPKTSWTKLTQRSGDQIQVANHTNWAVGDHIVLAASKQRYYKDTPATYVSESEEFAIVSVTAAGIQLSGTPAHEHCAANPTTYPAPPIAPNGQPRSWKLDERAEVGMLSHNVVIEGDTTSTTTRFGAHVMVMNCPLCDTPGFAQLSNVELRRVGQENRLGRYPFHWHLQAANGAGQFLKDCSIHESYNRGVVVHGSDYTTVQRNVLFDIPGHAVMLEDGGEQHNRFQDNLVLRIVRPTSSVAILTTDHDHDEPQNRSPSGFWITNPNNVFDRNVVADTIGTGFWFALHKRVTGASRQMVYYLDPLGVEMDPTLLPLGSFAGNVCHSLRSAIDIHDSVDDKGTHDNPRDDTLIKDFRWDPPQPVKIPDFVAYACATGLYAGTDFRADVTYERAILADNEWHVQHATAFVVHDSLFVEDSGNGLFNETHPSFCGHAMVMYDGPAAFTHCHLVGFTGAGISDMNSTVVSSVFGAALRNVNHRIEGLTYPAGGPSPQIKFLNFDPVNTQFKDARHWGLAVREDGSLSGITNGRTLVTNHPMMHIATADAPVHQTPNAWWSPFSWAHLVVKHYTPPDLLLPAGSQMDMAFVREASGPHASASHVYVLKVDPYRQIPIIAQDSAQSAFWYKVNWTPPTNVRRADFIVDDSNANAIARFRLQPNVTGPVTPTLVGGQITQIPAGVSIETATTTAFQIQGSTILLRMIVPAAGQTVTLTW